MVTLEVAPDDNAVFVERIGKIISGSAISADLQTIFVVKLDNWFDKKWLGFSHKAHGAFGVGDGLDPNVIPPFNPNRVVAESVIHRIGEPESKNKSELLPLHRAQESERNVDRRLSEFGPSVGFFWWSGNTERNHRGSLMGYVPVDKSYSGWRAQFGAETNWLPVTCTGGSLAEIKLLEAKGADS